MKYIEYYRDPELIKGLVQSISHLAKDIAKNVTVMEICGTHTHAIGRWGLRRLLPENVRLISGPGCPVCVTSTADVDRTLYLAGLKEVIFATFGDMLRVPGSAGQCLQDLRAEGAEVRVVTSPLDALQIARENPKREVVFLGIGFETTAPAVASTIIKAKKEGTRNFSVFSLHKTIPNVIQALIDDPALSLDGFLCPGHVSVITGIKAYDAIPLAKRAAVITGFEPSDILEGILMNLQQIRSGRFEIAIQYERAVKKTGNLKARELMNEVFASGDAEWRGLGTIPESGLYLKGSYLDFDAGQRFSIPEMSAVEPRGCLCGEVLKGIVTPNQCPLFAGACHPLHPVGPCMVSSEGTCAAYYKYERIEA
ncbi:MAG TPA: hydrogenase formation protein HypD [Syntrophales bacterium]|nr:hydrogenase formation protein HypD [Syntrophales bacterium]